MEKMIGIGVMALVVVGVLLTIRAVPSADPPVCTIDPHLAETLAQQTLALERIASVVELWEHREQQQMAAWERRRQQLQRDAPVPEPSGAGLPSTLK